MGSFDLQNSFDDVLASKDWKTAEPREATVAKPGGAVSLLVHHLLSLVLDQSDWALCLPEQPAHRIAPSSAANCLLKRIMIVKTTTTTTSVCYCHKYFTSKNNQENLSGIQQ